MSMEQAASMRNAIIKTIKDRSDKLEVWRKSKIDYLKLRETLDTFPDELTRDVEVRIGSKAIVSGEAYHTNEILVLLGDNWFTKKTAKQTQEVIDRRVEVIDKNIVAIEAQISKVKEGLDKIDSLESTVFSPLNVAAAGVADSKDGDMMTEDSEGLPLMDIREELDEDDNIVKSIVQPQKSSELQEFAQSHLSKIIEERENRLDRTSINDNISLSATGAEMKENSPHLNNRVEEIEEDKVIKKHEEDDEIKDIIAIPEGTLNGNDNVEAFGPFGGDGLMEIREEIDEDGNIITSSVQPHGQSEADIYMKLEQIAKNKEAKRLAENAAVAGPELPPDFVKVKDRKMKSDKKVVEIENEDNRGNSDEKLRESIIESSRLDKGKQKATIAESKPVEKSSERVVEEHIRERAVAEHINERVVEEHILERVVEESISERIVEEQIHEKPVKKFDYEAELKRAQKAIRPEDMIALELIADSFDDEEDLDFDDEEEWDFDEEELDYDDYDEEEQEEDEHGCTRGSLLPNISERNSSLLSQIQQLRQGNKEAMLITEQAISSAKIEKDVEMKTEKKKVRFSSELDIKSFNKTKSPSSINEGNNFVEIEEINDLSMKKSEIEEEDEEEEEEPKRISRFKAERMIYGAPKVQSAPIRVVNNSNIATRGPVSNIFEREPTNINDQKVTANPIVIESTAFERRSEYDQEKTEAVKREPDQVFEKVNLSASKEKSVPIFKPEIVPRGNNIVNNLFERPATSFNQEKDISESKLSVKENFNGEADISEKKNITSSYKSSSSEELSNIQGDEQLSKPRVSRFKQARLEKANTKQTSLPSVEEPKRPVGIKKKAAAKSGPSFSIKAPQRVYEDEMSIHDIESIAVHRESGKKVNIFSNEMMELAAKNYDQAVLSMNEEEYRDYIDKIMEDQEDEYVNITEGENDDRPLMSDKIPEHTFEEMADEFDEEGFAGYINNMGDSDDDEFMPDMYQREISLEYQRLRERMISQAGGFGKTDEEKAFEVMDEDGNEVKVSRFKAARLSNRKKF